MDKKPIFTQYLMRHNRPPHPPHDAGVASRLCTVPTTCRRSGHNDATITETTGNVQALGGQGRVY